MRLFLKIFKTLKRPTAKPGAMRILCFFIFGYSLFFLSGGDCSAREPAAPIPQKRAEKDYAPFPQPDVGYITDIANVLSKKVENKIERWLWQIEKKTKVEIIVVIILSIKDFKDTPNDTIEEFATALFNKYGIGNLPANNGVLLLVSVGDRKARIELGKSFGHARDADAQRIMDGIIVPKFKNADYPGGVTQGVKAIAKEFANVRIGLNWTLIILLIALPILGIVAYSLIKNGKRGWGWVVVGILIVAVIWIISMLFRATRAMPKTAGGAGGFGGGVSGGGGATGSW
jgi:uncharacterized protein